MLDLHKRKWLQDEGFLKVSKSGVEWTRMNSIFVKCVQAVIQATLRKP